MFYLLDKFLFFIMHEKLKPILIFNKDDLDSSDKEEVKNIYKGFDAPLIFTSAKENINVDTVRDLLKGKTTAVAGPSGVGKSTLINAIVGSSIMETGEISKKTLRGRHTTGIPRCLNLMWTERIRLSWTHPVFLLFIFLHFTSRRELRIIIPNFCLSCISVSSMRAFTIKNPNAV